MVNITHRGENREKITEILKVAQERFGHYGFAKTTMREIASDMAISKATLYYYFPDKESLFKAVIGKEQDDFFYILDHKLTVLQRAEDMLHEFSNVRLGYFKTFLNLSKLRVSDFSTYNIKLGYLSQELATHELEMVTDIMHKGKEDGDFNIDDCSKYAQLFLDLFKGLRIVVSKRKELNYISQEDYDIMEEQMRMFVNIFILGISRLK
jgi:Transcriptional regulator